MKFMGLDVSLNHGAAVEVETFSDGSTIIRSWYFTDKKTYAKKFDNGTFLDKVKEKDDDLIAVNRLRDIREWVSGLLLNHRPDFAGLEGYAYSMANQSHQLGEAGGVVRLALLDLGVPFRIHDPASIKLFTCGKGNADKKEVIAGARKHWGYPTPALDVLEDRTIEDIADACSVAFMVQTEHALRVGATKLAALREEHIRVFNRVTKANPVNLLARDWTRRVA